MLGVNVNLEDNKPVALAIWTPWGYSDYVEQLTEGVIRVSTPSHGGLFLSDRQWLNLDPDVRACLRTPFFAEEDCEEAIVRVLTGLADRRIREVAQLIAYNYSEYAPCIEILDRYPVNLHYHAFFYTGGLMSMPLQAPIESRVEAVRFIEDTENQKYYGELDFLECTKSSCFPLDR